MQENKIPETPSKFPPWFKTVKSSLNQKDFIHSPNNNAKKLHKIRLGLIL